MFAVGFAWLDTCAAHNEGDGDAPLRPYANKNNICSFADLFITKANERASCTFSGETTSTGQVENYPPRS